MLLLLLFLLFLDHSSPEWSTVVITTYSAEVVSSILVKTIICIVAIPRRKA